MRAVRDAWRAGRLAAAGLHIAWLTGVAALAAACSGSPAPPATTQPISPASPQPAGVLAAVTLPDASRADATVQAQLRERYAAAVAAGQNEALSPDARGAAYGALAILLHAGEYYDAAEPAYLNAQALSPMQAKWPYLLAHLYKSRGQTDQSQAAFARALALNPNDVATLIWLGRGYLDQGDAGKAEPLFARARAAAPQALAALAGLGQSALARRDFAGAAAVLEEALTLDPSAASLHSPLAMAYRGLGDTGKAEAHLRQWRNTEVVVADPVREELDLALQSGLSFELRGVRALESRDFAAAVDFFRQGVAITPGTNALGRSLRHKLGTALFLSGDLPGAVQRFEETVRAAPEGGTDESVAKAHYSLGVLMASAGRRAAAIRHLTAAVRNNPTYVEALQALGDQQRRTGQFAAALETYASLLRVSPRAAEARLGYGVALVRLRRFPDAKEWFEEGVRLYPDRGELRHALARLLATSPADGQRDGARALTIVEDLLKADKTTALGETMAMAFAEIGQFDQAVAVQRDIIDAAAKAGLTAEVRIMTENLRRYERRQPCRTPWPDADAIHAPGPPVTPGLDAALGTAG